MRHSTDHRRSLGLLAAVAALALAACAGEPSDIEDEPVGDPDAVEADAPGVGIQGEDESSYGEYTDQSAVGAEAIEGEIGSEAAEPGKPIADETE